MTKQEFINLLRATPQEKQIQDRLRDSDCFCVIGLLCNAIDPTAWVQDTLNLWMWHGLSFLPDPSLLPEWVSKHSADCDDGSCCIKDELVRLNDAGSTFAEIADYLETL